MQLPVRSTKATDAITKVAAQREEGEGSILKVESSSCVASSMPCGCLDVGAVAACAARETLFLCCCFVFHLKVDFLGSHATRPRGACARAAKLEQAHRGVMKSPGGSGLNGASKRAAGVAALRRPKVCPSPSLLNFTRDCSPSLLNFTREYSPSLLILQGIVLIPF